MKLIDNDLQNAITNHVICAHKTSFILHDKKICCTVYWKASRMLSFESVKNQNSMFLSSMSDTQEYNTFISLKMAHRPPDLHKKKLSRYITESQNLITLPYNFANNLSHNIHTGNLQELCTHPCTVNLL